LNGLSDTKFESRKPEKEGDMKLPKIHGLIDRRILVNYRVKPAVLSKLLPFRPKLINGVGIAGKGLTELDCALLMRGIDRKWYAREFLCAA
jgi:hypothetical protein